MSRKTIDVNDLRETVNAVLADSSLAGSDGAVYRRGMIAVLEEVLHRTGNYKGFQYLGSESVPHGEKPGINWGFDNDYDARFFNTDSTRVRYF